MATYFIILFYQLIFVFLSCNVHGFPNKAFLEAFVKDLHIDRVIFHSKVLGNKQEAIELKQQMSVPMAILDLKSASPLRQIISTKNDLEIFSRDLFPSVYILQRFNNCAQDECGKFLIDIGDTNMTSVQTDLDLLPLDIDDQVFLFKEKNNGEISIYETYKIGPNTHAVILNFGNYSDENGLKASKEDIWHRRQDMRGYEFRVATLESPPYITKLELNNETGLYESDGMFIEVFQDLQSIMNFTYTVKPSIDGQWGAKREDGSWTGMIGMLHKKQIDIAVTDFTVTHERSQVMTFGQPITQIYHCLFIKNPQGAPNFRAYSEPLRNEAWLVVFVVILISAPVLFVIVNHGKILDENKSEFSLSKSYVYSLSVMTFMRPWNVVPSTTRGKLAFGSLLVGGTLTYYHWEAMLISYLATRVIVLPFKNMQELVDQTSYKITLTPGSSYMDAFKYSKDPVWQEAWETRIKPDIDTYPTGLGHSDKIIAEPIFAMYDNYFAASTYDSYANCEIIAIPEKYDTKPYAYGFQKNSPYLGPFNYYLKALREKGATRQILDKYESRPQVCPDYSGKALGFSNCFTAFLCLLSGVLLSLIIFVIEEASKFLEGLNGKGFPLIHSYGKLDLVKEEQVILWSDSVEERSKYIIENQRKKINELEEVLKDLKLEKKRRFYQGFDTMSVSALPKVS